jgi:hypothetical protein
MPSGDPKSLIYCLSYRNENRKVKSKGRLQAGEARSPLCFSTPPISKAQEISEIISQQIQQRPLFSHYKAYFTIFTGRPGRR